LCEGGVCLVVDVVENPLGSLGIFCGRVIDEVVEFVMFWWEGDGEVDVSAGLDVVLRHFGSVDELLLSEVLMDPYNFEMKAEKFRSRRTSRGSSCRSLHDAPLVQKPLVKD
jgi:hypothetical protein